MSKLRALLEWFSYHPILVLVLVFLAMLAWSARASAAELEAFAQQRHRSNLFERSPEPTEDFVCGGIQATFPRAGVELAACHGFIARDCRMAQGHCDWRPGTEITTRWFPGRARKGAR